MQKKSLVRVAVRGTAGTELRELELIMMDDRPVAVLQPANEETGDDALLMLLPPGSVRAAGAAFVCDEEIDDPLAASPLAG